MQILKECTHGGGIATLAPRTQNGSKKIFLVISKILLLTVLFPNVLNTVIVAIQVEN